MTEGHLYVRDFARRHDLTTSDLAELLSVQPSTIRRYKTAPDAHMHRALNPVARRLLEWLDDHPHVIALPIARGALSWSNAEFDAACEGRSDIEVGELLSVIRQTVFRWRRDIPVPPTTARIISLWQAFGWPDRAKPPEQQAAIPSPDAIGRP